MGFARHPVPFTDPIDLGSTANRVGEFKGPDAITEKFAKESDQASGIRFEGTKVLPGDAPFAVELLKSPLPNGEEAPDQDSYDPIKPILSPQGDVFAEVSRGEAYALRIYNNSDHEIAARVLIDGISFMHFSEARESRGDYWIISSGEIAKLFGWHKDDETVESFLVSKYSVSEESELLKTGESIGSVYVDFYRSYKKGENIPAEDQRKGTVRGPEQTQHWEVVTRYVGPTRRAAVTIRYERAGS